MSKDSSNVKRIDEKYPDDQDLRVVVEEKFGLKNTQKFLRQNSRLLVHAGAKKDLSKIFQRTYIGEEKLRLMKDEVLNKDSTEKATAFIVESEESDEELVDELIGYMNEEYKFHKNKELELKGVNTKEDGIDITLSYNRKTATKQKFLSSQDKTVEFSLDSKRDDGTRVGRQEYRNADEFHAVSDFFEGWEQRRVEERRELVQRQDISLKDIPDSKDRVKLVDSFLQEMHEDWKLDYLLELGIEQEGQSEIDITEIESEDDEITEDEISDDDVSQDLRRITNAVLKGKGLRESQFVNERVGQGDFYFSSFRGFLKNQSSSDRIELEIKFKKQPETFDLQINSAAEEDEEGGYESKKIEPEWRSNLQDLFRGTLLRYYSELVDQPELFRQRSEKALEDIDGIGETIAESLNEEDIKKPADLNDVDKEFLMEIDGIGNEKAETILAAS